MKKAVREGLGTRLLPPSLPPDSCLQKLFEQGSVLLRALEWLGAVSGPLERRASAALLVANMARNGTASDQDFTGSLHSIPFDVAPLPDSP